MPNVNENSENLKLYYFTDSYPQVLQTIQTRSWRSSCVQFSSAYTCIPNPNTNYAISIIVPRECVRSNVDLTSAECTYHVSAEDLNKYVGTYNVIFPKLSREQSELEIFHVSHTKISKIKPASPVNFGGDFGSTLFFAKTPYAPFVDWEVVYTLRGLNSWFVQASELKLEDSDVRDTIKAFARYCKKPIEASIASKLLLSTRSPYELLCAIYTYDFDLLFRHLGDSFSTSNLNWQSLHLFVWWLQGKQSRLAKRMGYLGVESFDEQGVVWMLDMLEKEYLLQI